MILVAVVGVGELPDQAAEIVEAAKRSDLPAYLEADTRFHRSLLECTGNPYLVSIVLDLRTRTRPYGLDSLVHNGQLVASAEEHTSIVALLADGDPAAVEALMRHHLGHIRGIWSGK